MGKNGSSLSTYDHQIDLPALRQHKGISLREIADTTKISIRFLQAIEEGDFDLLPGGIYNTSYIRQYARLIGYEETKLLAYYHSAVETAL
jgi:cytoskeletal protein RodZ